jgi:hypothetical protein
MKRRFFSVASAVSVVLCIVACVFWSRGRWGRDEAALRYDRYLSDGSAASNQLRLYADKRLWLDVGWGRVGRFDGQLVWGYHINADRSGGRPRLEFNRYRYEPRLIISHFSPDVNAGGGVKYGRLTPAGMRPCRKLSV